MTQILENAAAAATKAMDGEVKEPQIPEGCVARSLNFRDRRLILFACRTFVMGKERKGSDYKKMSKLDKVVKLLGDEAVDDYFDRIEEDVNSKARLWTKQQNLYVAYEAFKSSVMTKAQFLERFPDHDLSVTPVKPGRIPKKTHEEERGKSSVFPIPAKLDVFIETSLKEMQWGDGDAEFVVELAEKYNLPDED